VSQFKYLGMTVTNQNLFQREIKRRLNSGPTSSGRLVGIVRSRTQTMEFFFSVFNSGNACYHSDQKLLSSCLLSKNIKIRIQDYNFCLWFGMGVKLGP
jgi:hypothetical protein